MSRNEKLNNLMRDLHKRGYDCEWSSTTDVKRDGKTDSLHMVIINNQARNAATSLDDDVRIELDEDDVKIIAEIAKDRGLLTFPDQKFRWFEGELQQTLSVERNAIGFIFLPSPLVGRLKRQVTKLIVALQSTREFLMGDTVLPRYLHWLKDRKEHLGNATKYALLDKDGEMTESGLTPLFDCGRFMEQEIDLFRKEAGDDFKTYKELPEFKDMRATLEKLNALLK